VPDSEYDELDARIVETLLADGRASLREIARELDIAASTVSTRLRQLEADDVISGYRPQVDYSAFGYPVTAVVRLQTTRPAGDSMPETDGGAVSAPATASDADSPFDGPWWTHVHRVTGAFDFVSIGRFPDTTTVAEAVVELRSRSSTAAVETEFVVETFRDNASLPLSGERLQPR
jgi:DNA-binding Lrp family transcriptional regulator